MSTPEAEPRPSLRRVVALGGLWLAVSAAALATPGCYGRNCEGSVETFGAEPGQGRMVDEDTWESSAIDGEWIPFPRQRYYVFDLHALGGRTPREVLAYVSAAKEPTKNGSNFTVGSGNLVEFFALSPNRVDVKNDTCSDYYIHLQVTAPPLPPAIGAEPTDAGADDATDTTNAADGIDSGEDAGP